MTNLDKPRVYVKVMKLSDGQADYFVAIKVGTREVTPHVFRAEFKAAYHVALYEWLLNDGPKPDLMAFDEGDWPAQATEYAPTEAWVIAPPFAEGTVGPFPSPAAAHKHAVDHGYDMEELPVVQLIRPEDDVKESELNVDPIPF